MGANTSRETYFELQNHTHQTMTTRVSSVDNYDWDGNSRPDRNLNGLTIAPGGTHRAREEVNANARNSPFHMTLTFSDGTVDEFRIHQKHAIGCCPGFEHKRRAHNIYYWRSGDKTLVVEVKNTDQQLQNEQAEEKNREGEAKMRQKQYEAAMKLFDEALSKANNSATINSIKKNKSEACTQIGKQSFQQGFSAEAQDKASDATSKFNHAKSMFQQAQNLYSSTEHQQNLKLANLKIDGNKLFNEANELEKQAFTLFEGARKSNVFNDYTAAQNKYKQAQAKYEEAAKKFEEGSKVNKTQFGESAHFTLERVAEVKKVIDDIDKVELSYNINNVNVDEEKKEENTDEHAVNTNLQEQIDAVIN